MKYHKEESKDLFGEKESAKETDHVCFLSVINFPGKCLDSGWSRAFPSSNACEISQIFCVSLLGIKQYNFTDPAPQKRLFVNLTP